LFIGSAMLHVLGKNEGHLESQNKKKH